MLHPNTEKKKKNLSQNPQKKQKNTTLDELDKKNKIWVSWNENIKHSYENLYKIESEHELQEIIANSDDIRIYGSKQSSADITAGVNTLVDISNYNKIISYNNERLEITVQSGIKLKDLLVDIEAKQWCIPCLPDINTVTVGGALATGTHGTSGKILADYIIECRMILADGSIKTIKEDEQLMDACRVSLGVLGVFSTITFKCEPLYTLHIKEAPQKDSVWVKDLSKKVKTLDFLRILWLPHTGYGYVISGDKIPADKEIDVKTGPSYLKHRRKVSKFLYGLTDKLPMLTAMANKILYRLFFSSKKEHKGSLYQATVTKSRGSTLELAEWTIGLDKFPEVFEELKSELQDLSNKSFVHIPMDVRFVSKDASWLSYAYNQDTVTMGCVTRNAASADSYEAFKSIEKIFLKHGGRPHWGKRFQARDYEMNTLYPKWNEFKALRKEMDPTNKFLNLNLHRLFNEPV